MVRYSPQPAEDDAQRHDAETRMYEPLHQTPPAEPADLVVAPPVYATNFNSAGDGRRSSPDQRAATALRLNAVLMWLFGLVEALVAIRFILKAVAADAGAPFAALIYGITGPLVAPFVGVLPSPALGTSVFELPALLAILIYFLVSLLLTRLIRILFIDQPRVR
jgi:uncharacterized protein YggT (Ycf19 family)